MKMLERSESETAYCENRASAASAQTAMISRNWADAHFETQTVVQQAKIMNFELSEIILRIGAAERQAELHGARLVEAVIAANPALVYRLFRENMFVQSAFELEELPRRMSMSSEEQDREAAPAMEVREALRRAESLNHHLHREEAAELGMIHERLTQAEEMDQLLRHEGSTEIREARERLKNNERDAQAMRQKILTEEKSVGVQLRCYQAMDKTRYVEGLNCKRVDL